MSKSSSTTCKLRYLFNKPLLIFKITWISFCDYFHPIKDLRWRITSAILGKIDWKWKKISFLTFSARTLSKYWWSNQPQENESACVLRHITCWPLNKWKRFNVKYLIYLQEYMYNIFAWDVLHGHTDFWASGNKKNLCIQFYAHIESERRIFGNLSHDKENKANMGCQVKFS